MSHVFVIAEAGISHDGDLRQALDLIDHAKAAGADACKFQTFNAQKLAARRKSPELFAKLKPYEMPLAWLPILKDHCDKKGIEFMTTCFDEETLKEVAPFVKRFKIGHVESQDVEFIDAHYPYRKEIVISNGPFRYSKAFYKNPCTITHLYAGKKYPTPIHDANLSMLWRDEVDNYDGYSDHTKDEMMGAFAVCAGAKIVEVHFRDYRTSGSNPDYCVSHDPMSLKGYVHLIRRAEVAVYGQAEEETRKLERPGSSPHTSHPQASEGSDLSVSPLGGLF